MSVWFFDCAVIAAAYVLVQFPRRGELIAVAAARWLGKAIK